MTAFILRGTALELHSCMIMFLSDMLYLTLPCSFLG